MSGPHRGQSGGTGAHYTVVEIVGEVITIAAFDIVNPVQCSAAGMDPALVEAVKAFNG